MTACSGVSRVSPGYVNPASGQFAEAVMDKGPLLLRIAGTPYAGVENRLALQVEYEMAQALAWTANPRFSTDPAKAAGGSFFVSLVFNQGYMGTGQCAATPTAGGQPLPGGRVEVSAAFCDGTDQLGSVAGTLDESSGLDDPRFASLIHDVALTLFPSRRSSPLGLGIGVGGGSGGVGVGGGVSIGF